MKHIVWILSAALVAAGIVIAQAPGAPATGRARGPAKGQVTRSPIQSPASLPGPLTVTPQTYSAEQVQAGELRFTSQCGFCHGRDAAGGETGPDLTRSNLVAEDVRGDKIGPLLREGRPDQAMPSFTLSETDLGAIVAFVHDQKTKFDALGGGRRAVDPSDLATGNAAEGERYFNGTGGCAKCHSATGDLAGVATRYKGLTLIQRILYPSGRPAPQRPKATVTLPSGQMIAGSVASEDEFTILILDPSGTRRLFEKSKVTFQIDDPMSAHFDQLGKYTDEDMHNVFAYLDTLK
jgi:cytochrome c oxidase cbb3-type subunit 3